MPKQCFKRNQMQRKMLARLKMYSKWKGNPVQRLLFSEHVIRPIANDGLVAASFAKTSEELDKTLTLYLAQIKVALNLGVMHFVVETAAVELTVYTLGWWSFLVLVAVYISIKSKL